ncbi:unnamed protein product [Symbiodinium pilosum]|uniref:Fe2OG dioxygenase domain-containing protein n=1 Tax=Symbiodinium pilosum TaxID=2952 RepID=A0A812IYB7_SYMPI|nr:unnamed protein product [Symbiodinium pilosum]
MATTLVMETVMPNALSNNDRQANLMMNIQETPEKLQATPTPLAAVKSPFPLLRASSLEDWLHPESAQFNGLLMERKAWWNDCQGAVDQVSRDLGEDEKLIVSVKRGPEGFGDFQDVAEKILQKVNLPQDVKDAVHGDICQLATTVGELCPWGDSLLVKLELIGEKSCRRWHRDYYCARAIVSYNSAGTLYTADDNVNFWELEHKGGNERIIRDKSEIRSAGVGDMLFIKGVKFPEPVKGLVHRSPETQYHDNGLAVNRLVLKVDVPVPAAWESDCDCCP